MEFFTDKTKSYSTSFETAKSDLKISDYAVYLMKGFNLKKAYFTVESILYLNNFEINNAEYKKSVTFNYEIEENDYEINELVKTKKESRICDFIYLLSNKVEVLNNKKLPNISEIKNVIFSVILTSKNPEVQKKILNASIKYFKDNSYDTIEYSVLVNELQEIYNNTLNIDFEELIDYGKNKGTEKIIMLHKLGILDFLRTKEPFDMSINSLATALSGFTGMDTKTIQSYINPIFSEKTNQKNNPLLSKRSVTIVEQKLNSIGFKQSI